jgi:hypothetical protein
LRLVWRLNSRYSFFLCLCHWVASYQLNDE